MTRPQARPSAGPGSRQRRREVGRVLTEAGLLGGPRRICPPVHDPFARRLRGALEDLGPTFTAFGLYLSSRADLLPAADCLELGALPDQAAPLPAAAVLEVVTAELGRPAAAVFADFDDRPRESRPLTQAHGARLVAGQAVVVRVVRPGVEAAMATDLPHLEDLAPAFAGAGRLDPFAAGAGTDFQEDLWRSFDLSVEAAALEALAQDTADEGLAGVPAIYRHLATPRVVVYQDLGGEPLDVEVEVPRELARRLCLAWLRQALMGRLFPIAPRGPGLSLLPDGRIGFTGGLFARPPAASQANLWGYLAAASRRDPDEVCNRLVQEMSREGPATSEESFRLRLRQGVPFRDGGWTAEGSSLAEHLFLHWRFARECGYRPRAHLVDFIRGLATVAAAARRLEPEGDSLSEALGELRLAAGVDQVGEMLAPEQAIELFERYAALLAQLPEQLDQVLTRAAVPRAPRHPSASPRGPTAGSRGSPVPLIASLIALAAVALLAHQIGGGAFGERLGALLFFGAGAALLWWLGNGSG
jgi:ubiquinone biosynthesis protein